MLTTTLIEWTMRVWNIITGCTKTSPGCENCYAEKMAKLLEAWAVKKYRNGFEVTIHPELLSFPKKTKKPALIFVNSMSDLFHPLVPIEFLKQVIEVMADCPQHIFQILTKRSQRLAELSTELTWPPNVWMGVSVENENYLYRLDDLRKVPTPNRFVSFEPLLGSIQNANLNGINWVIVGGESGPKSRAIQAEWVRTIRDQCQKEGIPFFFKQWGGRLRKLAGRVLDDREWLEFPPDMAKIREEK
jgi:protein gp37